MLRTTYYGTTSMCPLCLENHVRPFATVHGRIYQRCDTCLLTFLSPDHHPSPEAEQAEYEQHQNRPDDPGYRAFLSRLTDHLLPKLPPGASGLDLGSGPGPTLSLMLAERGFPTAIYDPYFAPDQTVLQRAYDFITCTETVEHFFRPAQEFERLNRLLKPGGWLGIMTEIQTNDDRFAKWWYVRDITHVCFYKHETMVWIANQFGWRMESPRKNVVLFQKHEKCNS